MRIPVGFTVGDQRVQCILTYGAIFINKKSLIDLIGRIACRRVQIILWLTDAHLLVEEDVMKI